MSDERLKKLANLLVNYSVEAKKGQKIKVTTDIDGLPLAREVVDKIIEAGAIPFDEIIDSEMSISKLNGLKGKNLEIVKKFREKNMKEFAGSIRILAPSNISDAKRIEQKNFANICKSLKKVNDYRVSKTNWVLLNYPNNAFAQDAGMSTRDYEDFLLKVCTIDYEKFSKIMDPLEKLIKKTDKVHIKKNNGTDLTFSIKGLPGIKCAGKRNIPDGEVFSAPVKNSINGTIVFNSEREYNGVSIKNVSLEFKDGKAIKATSEKDNDKFNELLDVDAGARYVGEFAFGLNPHVNTPTGDLLFDEKVNGSIHFALGKCYDECDNGNSSINHIDIVQLHRKEYGGGEIYFDGVLIMKDGDFVLNELKPLNKKNLEKVL